GWLEDYKYRTFIIIRKGSWPMYNFSDYYNNSVKISFTDHPFSKTPKHVLVICRYHDHWLLTNHKSRGYEFPGGKVEKGETAEPAAMREVKEVTGGVVKPLTYIALYLVRRSNDSVILYVYYATNSELEKELT